MPAEPGVAERYCDGLVNDVKGIHGTVGIAQSGAIAVELDAAPSDERKDHGQRYIGVHQCEDIKLQGWRERRRHTTEMGQVEKNGDSCGHIREFHTSALK